MDAPTLGPRPQRLRLNGAASALLSFRCLWWVLFAAACLGALFCLRQAVPRLGQAADITTPDSVMVQTALWARRSGIIYQPATAPPYTPAVYGPLYYLALIGLSYLTGARFAPLLLASRLFTLACFASLAVLLWFWSRRLGLPRPLAALAPMFLLSQIAFVHWNITTRPDLAAILGGAAAVYAATFLAASRSRSRLLPAILAGLFAATAILLKQSSLAAPAAIAFWLIARRQWRQFATFVITAGAVGCAVLAAFRLHGERLRDLFLLQHPYASWSTALGIVFRQFSRFTPDALLLALAVLGLIAACRAISRSFEIPALNPRPGNPWPDVSWPARLSTLSGSGWSLLIIYFLLAWAWGLLTLCLNSGGGGNYLLEGWTATALLAAAGVAALRPIWPATPAAARALVLLWVFVAAAAGLVTWHHKASLRIADLAPLASVAARHRVLTDVSYIGVHGQHPEYLDPYLLHTLELSGRWHSKQLVLQIRHHRFALILLDIGGRRANTRFRGLTRYDRPTLAAFRQAYRSYCVRQTVAVLIPAHQPLAPALASSLRAAGCRPALAALRFFPASP